MKEFKKRKTFVAGMIFMTALATLGVGASLAAWISTTARIAETEVAPKVAQEVELNNDFAIYNADDDTEVEHLYLICDAPANSTAYQPGYGVYWSTSETGLDANDDKLEISDIYVKGTLAEIEHDGILSVDTVDVEFTASTSFSFSNVTFGTFTAPASVTVAVADDAEVKSADFALPTVSYVNANIVPDATDASNSLSLELTAQIA